MCDDYAGYSTFKGTNTEDNTCFHQKDSINNDNNLIYFHKNLLI